MSYLKKYSNYKYNIGDKLILKPGYVKFRNSFEDNYIKNCEVEVIQQTCSLMNNLYNVKILSGNLKDMEALEIVEDNLYKKQTKPIKAIAVFDTDKIKGKVYFTQDLENNFNSKGISIHI